MWRQIPSGESAADLPAADPRTNYRLSGAIEYIGDAANAWFTLTSSAEGKVVWSRTFERLQPADAEGVTEDSIVISLTNSLLQSYGVIRARDRANQLASNAGDPRYRCILEAADAIRTSDRQTHELARACLEHLTSVDPGFAVGFTFLALIYNREFQLEYEPASRRTAGAGPGAARGKAGDCAASGKLARLSRADGHSVQPPRHGRGVAAGDKSLMLNKYDMLALGEYGGRLIFAGDVDKGMKMLRDAGAHGAVRPAWHHIYMFIGSYVDGDMVEAVRQANEIAVDDVALGQVARALAARAVGNQDGMRKAVERLIALGPGWRHDPRAELARLIPGEGIVDRLSRDLAAAGLPGGA